MVNTSGEERDPFEQAGDMRVVHHIGCQAQPAGDLWVREGKLAGKPAQVLGNPDAPHTLTSIDDFGSALMTLSQQDRALGDVWHVPNAATVSMRRFIEMVFQQLGKPPRLQPVPKIFINALALVVGPIVAVKETMYQSERPWVVDHSKYIRAFGGQPTPHEAAIAQTIAWYRTA